MQSASTLLGGGVKSIQRGVINLAGGAASNTATISAVVTGRTETRQLGESSGAGIGQTRISLTSTTVVTATRVDTSADTAVSWELTEYF